MAEEAFDFRIEIGERSAAGYQMLVRDRSGSLVRAVLELAIEEELRGLLARVETCVVASGARTRRAGGSDERQIQAVGGLLYKSLFAGELSGLLRAVRNEATRDNKHVRIVLQIEPAELAGLPWEFLYDAGNDEYLAHSCLLVRNPVVPTPEQPLRVAAPLRVLAMSAAPSNLGTLDLAGERARLEAALEDAIGCGRIELHWVPGETKRALLDTLRKGPWHIFHFIGHGDFDDESGQGVLSLTGPDGRADPLPAAQLASALGNHPALRMVVVNACRTARSSHDDAFSGVAAALIRRSVPAVVAMQYEISDAAALEFSRALYGAIADGEAADFAVRYGREAVAWAHNGSMEWGTPVLFLRSPDGDIFDLDHTAEGGDGRSVTGRHHRGTRHHTEADFEAFLTTSAGLEEAAVVRKLLAHAKRHTHEIHWGAGRHPSATPSFPTRHTNVHPWTVALEAGQLVFAVNFDWIHERGRGFPEADVKKFSAALRTLPGTAARFDEAERAGWRKRPNFPVAFLFQEPSAVDVFLAALDDLLAA